MKKDWKTRASPVSMHHLVWLPGASMHANLKEASNALCKAVMNLIRMMSIAYKQNV